MEQILQPPAWESDAQIKYLGGVLKSSFLEWRHGIAKNFNFTKETMKWIYELVFKPQPTYAAPDGMRLTQTALGDYEKV